MGEKGEVEDECNGRAKGETMKRGWQHEERESRSRIKEKGALSRARSG